MADRPAPDLDAVLRECAAQLAWMADQRPDDEYAATQYRASRLLSALPVALADEPVNERDVIGVQWAALGRNEIKQAIRARLAAAAKGER